MGCCFSKSAAAQPLTLPQHQTLEQQRADLAALDNVRAAFEWAYDEPHPLPPKVKSLPLSYVGNFAPHLKDFIEVFMRIEVSRVLEWTNLLHNWIEKHPDAGPFDKYKAIFTGLSLFKPPAVMNDWDTDEAFCYARTNGLYPWFLTRAELAKHDFPVSDAMLGDLIKGHTLAELEGAGRLFTIAFPEFEGVEPRDGAVIAAPIELHWVNDEGNLRPLAIQLRQRSADSPIFTPNDPKNLWMAVKMHANTAITTMHTYVAHATEMHWISETFWLAAIRNLAPSHPLYQFLEPHFCVLFFVNAEFRKQFDAEATGVAGAVQMLPAFVYMETKPPTGSWQLQSNAYKRWSFDLLNIPKTYKARGLDALKNQTYYRDDSLLMWGVHSKLCRSVIETFYKSDADVASDYQLQNWMKELASPLGGHMKGLPTDDAGKLSTVESLVDLVSSVFFVVTFKHSFLEAAKLDYFGFVPFNPDTFRLPIPQTKQEIPLEDILNALPGDKEAVQQGALMHDVGTAPSDFALDLLPKGYMQDAPVVVHEAIATWKKDLTAAEDTMKARNKRIGVNYTYCFPSEGANQIPN